MRFASIILIFFLVVLVYGIFNLSTNPENYRLVLPLIFGSISGIIHCLLLSQLKKGIGALLSLSISFITMIFLLLDLSILWEYWQFITTYHLVLLCLSIVFYLRRHKTAYTQLAILLAILPIVLLILLTHTQFSSPLSNVLLKAAIILGLLVVFTHQWYWHKTKSVN